MCARQVVVRGVMMEKLPLNPLVHIATAIRMCTVPRRPCSLIEPFWELFYQIREMSTRYAYAFPSNEEVLQQS